MFKRFTVILVSMFIIAALAVSICWENIQGVELYSDNPVTKPYRIAQDLGGKWNSYSSLRQALTYENEAMDNMIDVLDLNQAKDLIIPSSQGFDVAAKKFSVTGKWSYKTAQLVLEGVNGKVSVFLNGIDDVNLIGEVEGNGGVYILNFPASRFDFSKENTLYLKTEKNSIQQNRIFGWLWPEQGKITGQIRLEAVSETTIDLSSIAVSYDSAKKQVKARVKIKHHDMLEQGPWVLNGALTTNQQKLAECVLPLSTNGKFEQDAELIFQVPTAHSWSPEDPFLYELNLNITNNRGGYDSLQLPVGIRQLGTANGKWTMNGTALDVRGQIISQEQEYTIRNQRQTEAFLKNLKSGGYHVICFMGFFPDESWLYAADKLGVGVWLEMPVGFTASSKIPNPAVFEDLAAVAAKHPSVLAWTVAKGIDDSAASSEYLQKTGDMISGFSQYQLSFPKDPVDSSITENILILPEGLQGEWGKLTYYSDGSANVVQPSDSKWKTEKVAVILWLICLVFLSAQNFFSIKWKYQELFNDLPKRAVRRAFFWCCLSLVARMGTLGAIVASPLFNLPVDTIPPWISYDFTWLKEVQDLPFALVCILISFFLIVLRLLQVGVAASAFPQNPGTLGLTCWMERKYGWIVLVGVAFVLTIYGMPYYFPIATYILLSVIFLPARIRGSWKAGGKHSRLLIVPATVFFGILITCLWHYQDFSYLIQMVLPNIDFSFQLF